MYGAPARETALVEKPPSLPIAHRIVHCLGDKLLDPHVCELLDGPPKLAVFVTVRTREQLIDAANQFADVRFRHLEEVVDESLDVTAAQ